MADALQALLGSGAVPSVTFPPTSRYAEVGIATHTPTPGPGEEPVPVAFLRRRLVPPAERLALVHEYFVVEGDRRDLVAARQLGDPALWWRIADANNVLDPATMTEPVGRPLRITLPENVPAGADG